jgi:hypothetical protein
LPLASGQKRCCVANMKIRINRDPAKDSPVDIEATNESAHPDAQPNHTWSIRRTGFESIRLNAHEFSTPDEAETALSKGFMVSDHPDAQKFAKELIETGWAKEVRE